MTSGASQRREPAERTGGASQRSERAERANGASQRSVLVRTVERASAHSGACPRSESGVSQRSVPSERASAERASAVGAYPPPELISLTGDILFIDIRDKCILFISDITDTAQTPWEHGSALEGSLTGTSGVYGRPGGGCTRAQQGARRVAGGRRVPTPHQHTLDTSPFSVDT